MEEETVYMNPIKEHEVKLEYRAASWDDGSSYGSFQAARAWNEDHKPKTIKSEEPFASNQSPFRKLFGL
jgi:hypothetical protein